MQRRTRDQLSGTELKIGTLQQQLKLLDGCQSPRHLDSAPSSSPSSHPSGPATSHRPPVPSLVQWCTGEVAHWPTALGIVDPFPIPSRTLPPLGSCKPPELAQRIPPSNHIPLTPSPQGCIPHILPGRWKVFLQHHKAVNETLVCLFLFLFLFCSTFLHHTQSNVSKCSPLGRSPHRLHGTPPNRPTRAPPPQPRDPHRAVSGHHKCLVPAAAAPGWEHEL